jgi:hypothetical protein
VPDDVKLIAFYLPQFHPIPENDEWWGKGFTEWTNVSKAVPLFSGHYQPHLPAELGFYDLRVPEVREAQAQLAREHGIHGFCYYYYWFAGRRILQRPLEEVLQSGRPDFPFCICWANETWSRRWDGSEHEVLLKQEHTPENDVRFINDVLPLLRDPRYIRLDGAPLLLVYRVKLMPDPPRTADTWRRVAAEHGIERLHLCSVESFENREPRTLGFDSAVEFPPHAVVSPLLNKEIADLPADYTGNLYDYREVVQYELNKPYPVYRRFPGVMTQWDNTPRRGKAGNVFLHASPEYYELWLRGAIDTARDKLQPHERFVFINAWNEWAEGTHLEPDQRHGRQYLEATRRAVRGRTHWPTLMAYAQNAQRLEGAAKEAWLREVHMHHEMLERSIAYLMSLAEPYALPYGVAEFNAARPVLLEDLPAEKDGVGHIDRFNQYEKITQAVIERRGVLFLRGWAFCAARESMQKVPTYLVATHLQSGRDYYAPLLSRMERADVAAAFPQYPSRNTSESGFFFYGRVARLDPGRYRLGIIHVLESRSARLEFEGSFEVLGP